MLHFLFLFLQMGCFKKGNPSSPNPTDMGFLSKLHFPYFLFEQDLNSLVKKGDGLEADQPPPKERKEPLTERCQKA